MNTIIRKYPAAAVSVALLANGQISLFRCAFYILAQIGGSVTGSGLVLLMTSGSSNDTTVDGGVEFDSCVPKMEVGYEWQGMAYEFLFTGMLIMQV